MLTRKFKEFMYQHIPQLAEIFLQKLTTEHYYYLDYKSLEFEEITLDNFVVRNAEERKDDTNFIALFKIDATDVEPKIDGDAIKYKPSLKKIIRKKVKEKNMKNILKNTISELKKEYTNFSIWCISIFSVLGIFTPLILNIHNSTLTVISVFLFIIMITATMPITLIFTNQLEEVIKETKFAKKSIATLFVKNANHTEINITTIFSIIALIYIVLAITTGMIFPLGVVVWLLMLASLILS